MIGNIFPVVLVVIIFFHETIRNFLRLLDSGELNIRYLFYFGSKRNFCPPALTSAMRPPFGRTKTAIPSL